MTVDVNQNLSLNIHRGERKPILVIGAGFAGAVAARSLAEAGYSVHVVDKRPHIAGNAFDEIDSNGVRVHRYGPHLFHTSNERVVTWLSAFTSWTPYYHKVSALLPDLRNAPLPINLKTLEIVFNKSFANSTAAEHFLSNLAIKQEQHSSDARTYLISKIGSELTDLFFAPYSKKMWGHELSEIDCSIVKRIPIRFDNEDRYFPNDTFQAMPTNGYTSLFHRILEHKNIRVELSVDFSEINSRDFLHQFLSMPIDEFFEFKHGHLPYRSIKFHHKTILRDSTPSTTPTLNFTDSSPYTRSTFWHLIASLDVYPGFYCTKTTEEPCDYFENRMERYYPIKTADGKIDEVYTRYKKEAETIHDTTFIGRCGTYQYLDMHQVISQTLSIVDHWLKKFR